ncbi:hypothetical protein [uncultured Tateyamaria sp.]|uniref:hypothetical protein n=1 Tax=uncultured Tateyamaria sp. TaxID=455651 RepID=UPI0026393C18|nr:hypothetical protein [uncultured Tateyamaria sp.]
MTLSHEDLESLARTIAHQERVISSLSETLQEQQNPEEVLRSLRVCGFSVVLTSDMSKESRIEHTNHVLGPELSNVLEDIYSNLEHPRITPDAKREVLEAFRENYGFIRGDEAPLEAKAPRNDVSTEGAE